MTPQAFVAGEFLVQELGPSGVMVEMAGYQRMSRSRLSRWVAVVDGLGRRGGGSAFDLAGDGVEIAGAGVRGFGLPFWIGFSGGFTAASMSAGCPGRRSDSFSRRGVVGVEVLVRLVPCSVDEMSKRRLWRFRARLGVFWVFGAGP